MNAPATVSWQRVEDSAFWDNELAALGGHPLQSALWGDARRAADGIEDVRFLGVFPDGRRSMIRLELRRVPLLGGVIGWAPRGPAGAALDSHQLRALAALIQPKPHLMVTDEWRERTEGGPVETIWIDLSSGKETLWQNLDKRIRYSVGKANRSGLVIGESRTMSDQSQFFSLMRGIGEKKEFALSVSPSLLSNLLASSCDGKVSAHLFLARFGQSMAAAGLVMKCGESVHYILGGTERAFSKERAGEALQWFVIEWAIARGATRYDLEGIDRTKNPGTYAFKKKMGGREVALQGKFYCPVSTAGIALGLADRWRSGNLWSRR